MSRRQRGDLEHLTTLTLIPRVRRAVGRAEQL